MNDVVTIEDFRKKVEEIKKLNPNISKTRYFMMTINDFAFITQFAKENQQPQLDNDIEEALNFIGVIDFKFMREVSSKQYGYRIKNSYNIIGIFL